MSIRTVIVDDESLARHKLRSLLAKIPDLEIIDEASSVSDLHSLVEIESPQLLFLDIRMPGTTGIEFARAQAKQDHLRVPHIVVTTAFHQYAVDAFDIGAVDYLLKPFTLARLRIAVERVRDKLAAVNYDNCRRGQAGIAGPYTTRIVVRSRGRILFLPISEIRWISAEENYVRICTNTETHLLRETMQSMEQQLDPRLFLRVHRSTIVNLRYVREVRSEAGKDLTVRLISGDTVPMSRTYYSRIAENLREQLAEAGGRNLLIA